MSSSAKTGAGDGRLSELDGLRGIAVAAVIGFHCAPHLLTGGWLGVDVFFVLSGYLITALLVRERERTGRIALGAFYLRRALRLAPALLVVVAVHLAYSLGRADADVKGALEAHAIVLAYASNWARALEWNVELGGLAHTWSLAIEEQFYLVWPLLLLLLLRGASLRAASAVVLAAALVVAAWRASLFLGGCGIERVYSGFDVRSDALLLGSAAALYERSGGVVALRSWPGRALTSAWALVALGALLVVDFMAPAVYLGLLAGFALGCAATLPSIVTAPGPWSGALLRWTPLVWTGKLSYGLYLWHFVVLECAPFPAEWPLRLRALVVVVASFALATASYVLVERPFLRLKGRFERSRLAPRGATIMRPEWPVEGPLREAA